MKETNMTVKTFFMLLCLASSISPAIAVETGLRPNAAEMLRLPPYCQARFKAAQGSPEWNAWRDQIGHNFIDLHHYCAGLNYVNRYWSARNARDRGFYLQRAMGGFDYLVKAEKPDFALRAELYSNRGGVFKLMRKPGEAVRDYNKALSINPRIVKPYLELANLHVAGKSSSRALETITEGLRHLPDSTALQRRYLELGGKKPFPEPLMAIVAEPEPVPVAETTQIEPATPTSSASEQAAIPEDKPSIGTPTNPYCRFCPAE